MEEIDGLIKELEDVIEQEHQSFEDEKIIKKAKIQILGQFALLLDKEASAHLTPAATMDVDALLDADWFVEKALRDALKSRGLEYDDLSNEVWIPEDGSFVLYYDSELLRVSYLDPISTLTSKAIKAKEKNRPLIRKALKYYGKKLADKIEQYEGDLEFFDD